MFPFLRSGVRSWKDLSPRLDDRSPTNDDIDSKSDGSDSVANRSVRSSSGNPLGGTTQDELGNRVCKCLKQFSPS